MAIFLDLSSFLENFLIRNFFLSFVKLNGYISLEKTVAKVLVIKAVCRKSTLLLISFISFVEFFFRLLKKFEILTRIQLVVLVRLCDLKYNFSI